MPTSTSLTCSPPLSCVCSKMLPDPTAGRSRVWAFVDAVSGDIHEVERKLDRYEYDTATVGHREVQPARLCGEAHYDLVVHTDRDSHLAYVLEYPEQPTAVQLAFHIHKQGDMVTTVKNPVFNSPAYSDRWAGFSGGAKANLPPHLVEKFRGKVKDVVRYTSLDTVEFLNIEHCEVVLIGVKAKEDMRAVMEELEAEVEEEGEKSEKDVYKELDTDPKEFPDAVESFK
jgi:hypothetical protein